ncbi:unnamed protein product [Euphydryas editha]|uniref:Salivary secreted peptide n=1 Tax=Euphydryas editha TaxID=104508 RepID=A0AAU9V6E9_EUPED|nr:unnamed protein product [Euphydryas editha]
MASMLKLVFVLFIVLYIDCCNSDNNLVVGDSSDIVVFEENVKLSSLPFWVRKKNVYYSGNEVIRGISAIDQLNTKSEAKVTEGGVGFTFTNIKLKSERGSKLNYRIKIFL